MKTPHIPRSEDFSHPASNADMAMERSNAYTQAYWEGNRYWRNKLDWKLTILTIASIGSVALGKGLLKGELANYRAWTGVLAHGGLIGVAASLTDAIRQHRQAQIGWENSTRTQIETAEDLVQRQAERNYNLMGKLDGSSSEFGIDIQELPPPIPVEDLAATLAQETGGGTLIIAPPGCGKTSLIRHAMKSFVELYNWVCDITVVDCKGDEDAWLQIESDPQRFFLLDDDSALKGVQRLNEIKSKLTNSAPSYPTAALIDEWNNGVSSIENSPEASSDQKKQSVSNVRQIVTKGRSKKVYGWLTTHSPNTDAIGMDSPTRQGLNIIALARKNKLSMIVNILKRGGKDAFVDDDETRAFLLAQYQAYRSNAHGDFDPEIPIALTNLGGDWRLIKLPNYAISSLKNFQIDLQNGVSPSNDRKDFQEEIDEEVWGDESPEVLGYQGFEEDEDNGNGYAYKTSRTYGATLRIPVEEVSGDAQTYTYTSQETSTEEDTRAAKAVELAESTWNSWDERKKLETVILIGKAVKDGYSKTRIIEEILKMGGRNYAAGSLIYEKSIAMLESLKLERSSTS